jgi:hypothetical protein
MSAHFSRLNRLALELELFCSAQRLTDCSPGVGRAGILKDLLVMLEGVLARYTVPLGVVDGSLLVALAGRGDGE